jgi:radical SAM protein with 4Fe4S-binding SPASM domain
LYQGIPLQYFVAIEIEINHHCNLSCSYCPNSTTNRPSKKIMTIESFQKILEQLKDINFAGQICYHFYNEPLLHPQLTDFVLLSRKILPFCRPNIYTNGVFLSLDKFKALYQAGATKFTITKHAGLKDIAFDETWSQLTDEEKKLVKYSDYTNLSLTNRGGLVDFGDALTPSIATRPCMIPMKTIVVTLEGNVLACYEDYHQKNIMGNVFSEHIKDIWSKEKFINLRANLKMGKRSLYQICSTCNNKVLF